MVPLMNDKSAPDTVAAWKAAWTDLMPWDELKASWSHDIRAIPMVAVAENS
jgi:hypothetical protein